MEALIIVDVQKDFLPGGALAVEEGDQIIPKINDLTRKFNLVVATQDWHPANHISFASQHMAKNPGDIIKLQGLEQILWPDHCIQGSKGAEFSDGLDQNTIKKVFQKGIDPEIDSYSGFFDNGHKRDTGLHDFLQGKNIDTVIIVGLATDYCVRYTALDALKLGYKTKVVSEATRAVDGQEQHVRVLKELEQNGAIIIEK